VFFKFNDLKFLVMKGFLNNTEEKRDFNYFEALTTNEMFQVRGGGDLKPASRDKDLLEAENE